MKKLQFHYHMDISFSTPVCNHTYKLKCIPRDTDNQRITECNIEIFPDNRVHRDTDSFGNIILYGNVENPHDVFWVDVRGSAVTGIYSQLPAHNELDKSIYKYFTPLTSPGDNIKQLREECRPGLQMNLEEKVSSYMHAVHCQMQYRPGSTSITTTAESALVSGNGVCQDFTHILLAMCRIDRIPARYVVGMFVGEGASHAWVEVFDGTKWIGFDPTNDRITGDTYIKISHGRDFHDCSINRGTFTGMAQQTQQILMEVDEG